MNPTSSLSSVTTSRSSDASLLTRREALRRAALFLGAALTPSLMSGVLEAATVLPAAGAKAGYLTGEQIATAGAVAERILPQTDTPGALAAGVPAFIDLMYGKYLPDEDRKMLVAGLSDLEASSVATHQKPFTALTVEQQDALLTAVAQVSQAKPKSFFAQIKELTIVGYFTSESVGRNVLHYDPIPGPYKGCIPLAEVGNRSWTK